MTVNEYWGRKKEPDVTYRLLAFCDGLDAEYGNDDGQIEVSSKNAAALFGIGDKAAKDWLRQAQEKGILRKVRAERTSGDVAKRRPAVYELSNKWAGVFLTMSQERRNEKERGGRDERETEPRTEHVGDDGLPY